MKKTLAMSSLLLALALGSCSSDEPVDNGGTTGGDELGYVSVNIVQPSSTTSRAALDGFEYGSEEENKAKTGLFYIFKEDGSISGTPQEINLNGSGEGNSPEVERIYNAVLVIDGSESDPAADSKQIVCVLNAPTDLKNANVQSLNDLKNKIGNYRNHEDGTFIMTNSVFASDGKFATEIGAGKVKKSAAEALNDPVQIYVERVVAKVRAKAQAGGMTNTEGAKPVINGTETSLDITVTGIEIANIASKSNLFKSVAGAAGATDGIWKVANVFDTTNKRSYWETVPEIGTGDDKMEIENRSYNEIIALNPSTDENPFDINNVNYVEYVQPNTLDDTDNEIKTKTCVLVTAQLTQNNNPFTTLAYIRGGYTTIDDAKKVVATYLATKGWYKKTGDNKYTQLEPGDLDWKNKYDFPGDVTAAQDLNWLKDYEVVAQLKSGEGAITEIYDIDGNQVTDGVNTVNSHLRKDAKNYRARVFTDGKCYYYVYIDQSPVVDAIDNTYLGVVRNHIYDLTLQSIKGIGTPVFDPKDVIIPQTPGDETTFYLSAKVNVLAWKVAAQNINFQGK